jgi:tetratricopeptide (TPR) repeat protein
MDRGLSAPGRGRRRVALAAACAVVLAVLAGLASSVGSGVDWAASHRDEAYNLLARGFASGRLSLARDVPAGLASLPDPYDPVANQPYRQFPYGLHDLSYFRGRLYLYFGPAPAVLLFGPWRAATGTWLSHRAAAAALCGAGFLALAAALLVLVRRFHPGLEGLAPACCLVLGLADGIPVLLRWTNVYEVAIAAGHAASMGALACVCLAVLRPAVRGRWLMAAGTLYGLAIASRPSLLPGAAILLVPVLLPPGERSGRLRLLAAAAAPVAAAGAMLLAYNALRFGDPLEFGQRYQLLVGRTAGSGPPFGLRHLPFNLGQYFLEPPRLQARFPYLRDVPSGPVPAGHGLVESPFGVLACVPLCWLALAAPLGWRRRPPDEGRALAAATGAAALLFATGALTVAAYWWTAARYEADFLPPLVLLAVLGILALEREFAPRPAARRLVRAGWLALAAASVAFNLLASFQKRADQYYERGQMMLARGRPAEAAEDFRRALSYRPGDARFQLELASALRGPGSDPGALAALEDFVRRNPASADGEVRLGSALREAGRQSDAAAHFNRALSLDPSSDDAEAGLGFALAASGREREAEGHFRRALRIRASRGEPAAGRGLVHSYEAGEMLLALGSFPESEAAFREALRIKPDYAEALRGLAEAENAQAAGLASAGRGAEALPLLEDALRLRPGYAEACSNLGLVLAGMGRGDEAVSAFRRALGIDPALRGVRANLGYVLLRLGRTDEAAEVLAQDARLEPGDAQGLLLYGVALGRQERRAEAQAQIRRALELDPTLPGAREALDRLLAEDHRRQ